MCQELKHFSVSESNILRQSVNMQFCPRWSIPRRDDSGLQVPQCYWTPPGLDACMMYHDCVTMPLTEILISCHATSCIDT